MKPLLVLLVGTTLAVGASAQVRAHSGASDDHSTAGRYGLLGPAKPAGNGTPPSRAGTMPAPPPPEIALRSVQPASRVRAVILTVAEGEREQPPTRTAFLNCAPVGGSHPSATAACRWLSRKGVEPATLRASTAEPCTMVYSPVTVTASGIWDGKYFRLARTFGNDCEMRSSAGALFDF